MKWYEMWSGTHSNEFLWRGENNVYLDFQGIWCVNLME